MKQKVERKVVLPKVELTTTHKPPRSVLYLGPKGNPHPAYSRSNTVSDSKNFDIKTLGSLKKLLKIEKNTTAKDVISSMAVAVDLTNSTDQFGLVNRKPGFGGTNFFFS